MGNLCRVCGSGVGCVWLCAVCGICLHGVGCVWGVQCGLLFEVCGGYVCMVWGVFDVDDVWGECVLGVWYVWGMCFVGDMSVVWKMWAGCVGLVWDVRVVWGVCVAVWCVGMCARCGVCMGCVMWAI